MRLFFVFAQKAYSKLCHCSADFIQEDLMRVKRRSLYVACAFDGIPQNEPPQRFSVVDSESLA